VSDLTTVGAVISYSNTSELTGTAINAVMTDGTNTYVGGYATTLETHYNGAVHHYDGIVVQSGTRVGLGKQGDANYVFYTDNADATIKRLPFYMPVSVTNISVGTDNSEQTVKVGDTIQMTASALPVNASDTTVTWSVDSGTGTATIDVNGLLTGETVGTVTVNATANDGSGIMGSKNITVTAADIAVQVINVSSAGNVVNMTTGETLQCSAEVLPVDATDRTVTWQITQGAEHATIDANGLITAISSGDITIEATANDSSAVTGTLDMTIISAPITQIDVRSDGNVTHILMNTPLMMFADVLPSEASNATVVWRVEPGSGAGTIDATGQLIGTQEGTVTVVASSGGTDETYGTMVMTIELP